MVVEALVIPAFLDVSPEDSGLDALSWNLLPTYLAYIWWGWRDCSQEIVSSLVSALSTILSCWEASHCDCPTGSVWGH